MNDDDSFRQQVLLSLGRMQYDLYAARHYSPDNCHDKFTVCMGGWCTTSPRRDNRFVTAVPMDHAPHMMDPDPDGTYASIGVVATQPGASKALKDTVLRQMAEISEERADLLRHSLSWQYRRYARAHFICVFIFLQGLEAARVAGMEGRRRSGGAEDQGPLANAA